MTTPTTRKDEPRPAPDVPTHDDIVEVAEGMLRSLDVAPLDASDRGRLAKLLGDACAIINASWKRKEADACEG